jgi:hypothetical protein
MRKIIIAGLIWLLLGISICAQNSSVAKSTDAPVSSTSSSIAITPDSTPVELARAALAAQGGDKFKNMVNMSLSGTVDIYPPRSIQSISGKFLWIIAGDKLRIELNAQPLVFKQIFDGQRSFSSIPGLQMGTPKSSGLALLKKFDQPGYTVSALPNKKKWRAFSIADAEGHQTEFYIDSVTGRVMMYRITSKQITFATEHSKLQEVEGVLVPYRFSQKLEMPQGSFYIEFKVKDAKVNQPLGDDVFAIP